jgi:hypothetical protein
VKTPSRSAAFTLVEVTLAVSIAVLLVLGVSAATRSTVKTAERQKSDARLDEQRACAIELLRQDWRSRRRVENPDGSRREGRQAFVLSTTADSLSRPSLRGTLSVTYSASEKGLFRDEGMGDLLLLPGRVGLEFWNGSEWAQAPRGEVLAIRLTLVNPDESVVLR